MGALGSAADSVARAAMIVVNVYIPCVCDLGALA